MSALFSSMLLVVVIALSVGCASIPSMPGAPTAPATLTPAATSSPIITAAPTATPMRTAIPVLTSTPFQTVASAPTPAPVAPGAIDDTWATYTNKKYGFSFRYPPGWNLKEILDPVNTMSGHAVHLTLPTHPAVRMIVAFKRADEDARIAPTGIGSGDLITRSVVALLGQEVERIVLVAAGKDLAVYYGWPGSTTAGDDLIFWLALDCACSAGDPAAAGLTPDVERIADAIVESISVKK